jgi:hypothetical protein
VNVVVVAAAAACVPAWQRDVVAALRAASDFDVRVVRADAPPWSPPRGAERRFAGPALAPATLAFDGDGADGMKSADVVVDLTGSLADTGARLGVWSFRLGDGGDATLPFAREIAGGARAVTVELVRRSAGERAVLRSGRFPVSSSYAVTARLALGEAAAWPAALAAVADHVALLAAARPAPARVRCGRRGAPDLGAAARARHRRPVERRLRERRRARADRGRTAARRALAAGAAAAHVRR